MNQPVRTLMIGALVLLVSGCATSVAGTAEVNSAAAAALPGATVSSGAQSSGAPSSTNPVPTAPRSFPEPSGAPGSGAPGSGAPESGAPGSGVAGTSSDVPAPALSAPPASSPPTSASAASSPPATARPATPTPATSPRPATSAPSTSKSVSRTTKLNCPAGALIPSARTFCYRIPAGFVDGSSTATYPGTDPVKSALQIKGTGRTRDLIFVTSTVLDVNADELGDAVIKASLAKAFSGNSSTASNTPIKQTSVAGDRAFETTIKFTDGVQQRYLIIFAGHSRVSVSCQWQDHAATITAGCGSVLGSLQIKNP